MSKANRRKRARKRNPAQRSGRRVADPRPARRDGGYGLTVHGTAEPYDTGNLHPSLRGLGPDDEIDVIITPDDDAAPPPGGGELLGTLRRPMTGDDGRILSEGARVWRDLRTPAERRAAGATKFGEFTDDPGELINPAGVQLQAPEDVILDIGRPGPGSRTAIAGGPHDEPRVVADYRQQLEQDAVPAAFRARRKAAGGSAADLVQALEEESEGLAARLARGLSAEELAELAPQIARAASIGGVAPGKYSFTTGQPEPGGEIVVSGPPPGPGLATESVPATLVTGGDAPALEHAGLQPGDIIAPAQPIGYMSAGIPVPEGAGRSPDDQVWRPRVTTQPREEMSLGPVTAAVLDRVRHIEAGDPAILDLRPSEVLAMHTDLADLMANPHEKVLRYYHWFMERTIGEAHTAGGAERAREYWEGMFWPATTAREWTTILARLLRSARTYKVTAEMVDKVTEQYAEDLASGWYAVDEDDLPWPAGFAWLDAPLTFTDKFGKEGWNRAVSWGQEYLALGSMNPRDSRRAPGARIVSWSWHDDRDSYWTPDTGTSIQEMGGLAMAHAISFPYRARLNVKRDAQGRATQDDTIRWVRTLWKVLSSEISATRSDVHIERHVRKRALRSLRHGEVHVVTLRRKHYVSDGEGGHQARIYTCRWPVNGFWRHSRRDADWEDAHHTYDEHGRRTRHHATPDETREYCAICGAPVSWIGTFVKGPPGAPWKDDANRTVFVLRR